MNTTAQDLMTFASTAVRRPAVIGAIAPSSAALAERLATVVPRTGRPVVVELGPGTGVVSTAIGRRLPAAGRLVGVEIDGGLVEHLRRRDAPLEVVHGDAVDLRELLAANGIDRVDAVVSGLPWVLLGRERQDSVLNEVVSVLAPSGVFTTFAYTHALASRPAVRFRRRLHTLFDEVLMTSTVWCNAPPAITYVCRRASDARAR